MVPSKHSLKHEGKNVSENPLVGSDNASLAITSSAGDVESSDLDITPKPNPLVSKLKLVDEKEGRELKNKIGPDKEQGSAKRETSVKRVDPIPNFLLFYGSFMLL